MCDRVEDVLDRRICELADDGRVDAEDARQIGEAAAAVRHMRDPWEQLAGLLRRPDARLDPQAFRILKAALQGEIEAAPDRVLLRPGARGTQVHRLRAALGAASRVLADRRLDPGPGERFDAACQAALRAFQLRLSEPPSGLLDSRSLLKINYVLNESEAPLLDIDRPRPRAPRVRLEFYPGDAARKLVVRRAGRVVDVFDMRGGPAVRREDTRPWVEDRFSFAPTPRGRFTVAGSGRHTSRAWPYSQIPFGAELRWHQGQVQFRASAEAGWRYATGPESVFADRGPAKQFEVEQLLVDGRLPETYQENDFGHRAVYLERGGRIQGHLIHPTPPGERHYGDDAFELTESHGCEHMRPADLDEALAKGYFRPGTPFVVKPYDLPLPADVTEFLRQKRGRQPAIPGS